MDQILSEFISKTAADAGLARDLLDGEKARTFCQAKSVTKEIIH